MSDRNTGAWVFLVMAMVVGVAGFIVGTAIIGKDFAFPAMIVASLLVVFGLRSPLGKALAEGLRSSPEALPDEATLAELDELRAHVLELEERMNFAERLLSQGSSVGQPRELPGGPV